MSVVWDAYRWRQCYYHCNCPLSHYHIRNPGQDTKWRIHKVVVSCPVLLGKTIHNQCLRLVKQAVVNLHIEVHLSIVCGPHTLSRYLNRAGFSTQSCWDTALDRPSAYIFSLPDKCLAMMSII